MNTDPVRDGVMQILREEMQWNGPLPEGELTGHLDSLQRMTLLVAIEDRFLICFEPEDEASIHDFEDLLLRIEDKVRTQGRGSQA